MPLKTLLLKIFYAPLLFCVSVSAIVTFVACQYFAPLFSKIGPETLGIVAGATLLSGFFFAQLLLALFLFVTDYTSVRLGRENSTVRGALAAGALFGAVAFWPIYSVGRALSQGAWISKQPFAPFIPIGAGIAGLLFFFATTYLAYRYLPKLGKNRFVSVANLLLPLLATLLLAAADTVILPLLYPEIHLFLLSLTSLAAVLFGRAVSRLVYTRAPRRLLTGVSVVCLCVFFGAVFSIARTDRPVLSELVSKSQVAALVLGQVGTSSSKGILAELLIRLPESSTVETEDEVTSFPFQRGSDWNAVLIVVDAARADVLMPEHTPPWKQLSKKDIPFLSKWMKDAYRFPYAYSDSNSTHASMPSLLRSIRPNEDPLIAGEPVARFMSSIGRTPIAVVVNNLFSKPSHKSIEELYTGFENVDVYYQNTQQLQNDIIVSAIDKVRSKPFFAWIHLYSLHRPGFFDNRMLTRSDGTLLETYQKSIRWLDAELRKLFARFQEMGLDKNTVFILAADHGEGLGLRGMNTHGKYLHEEEVRVPLVFKVPGHKGGTIQHTVANIDIVPTIADLLGERMSPRHQGHSLVPLMARPDTNWEKDYYLRDAHEKYAAVISRREKLIYQPTTGLFFRYDMEKDPLEKHNLFGKDAVVDLDWVQRLAAFDQQLFKGEVDGVEETALLLKRLSRINGETQEVHLRLLLGLASISKSAEIRKSTLRLFKNAPSDKIRLAILKYMFHKDKGGFGRLLENHLKAHAASPAGLRFVKSLAEQGQPKFSASYVAAMLGKAAAARKTGEIDAWLSLIKNWNALDGRKFAGPLLGILSALLSPPNTEQNSDSLLEAALMSVSHLKSIEKRDRHAFEETIVPLLNDTSFNIQIAACAALGALKSKAGLDAAVLLLNDKTQDLRVRKAAMNVLVAVEKEDSVPMLIRCAEEEALILDVIDNLGKTKSEQALPFLNKIQKSHYRSYVRSAAGKAILRIGKK